MALQVDIDILRISIHKTSKFVGLCLYWSCQ